MMTAVGARSHRVGTRWLAWLACWTACSDPAREPAPSVQPPVAAAPTPTPPQPRPVAPWLVDVDDAALARRFDAMRRSPALRCVIDVAVRERETSKLFQAAADEAPGVVLRAIAEAVNDHPGVERHAFEPRALASSELLERGKLADGRMLLESSEARDDPFWAEHRAALGLPYPPQSPRTLQIITELALAGRVDDAERLYTERVATRQLEPYELEHHVRALVALGRSDDAAAVVAREPPQRRWEAQRAWMRVALRRGVEIAPALDRLLVARTDRGVDWIADGVIATELIRFARGMGHAHLMAPLRRRLLADLSTAELGLDSEFVLASLADEILAHDDTDEIAALDPVLARSEMNVWKRYVAAVRALHHGSLPQAIDAIAAVRGSMLSVLYVRAWVRHAVAGLDDAVDRRFVATACPPGT